MKIATVGFAAIGALSLGYLLTRSPEPSVETKPVKPARSRKTTKRAVAPRAARRAPARRRKQT